MNGWLIHAFPREPFSHDAARIRRLTLNNFRSYHAAQIDLPPIWWC